MERAVVTDKRRRVTSQHFAQRFFARVLRNRGVQPSDGKAQAPDEDDIGERTAFGSDLSGRTVYRRDEIVPQFCKPT